MSRQFQFLHEYFNSKQFSEHAIRIEIEETPSFDIQEDEYSLRATLRFLNENRTTAIEHHPHQERHREPHLQFKLHCDGVGVIRVILTIANEEEYYNAVLGFIYKMKTVLMSLEEVHPGITNAILKIDRVNELAKHGMFLQEKIQESISTVTLERRPARSNIESIRSNPLLLSFIGKDLLEEALVVIDNN